MLERKENESALAYHKRLVYGKLVDKTLADVDYTELAPLVYGQDYNADVARRMLYGSRMTLELLDRENEGSIKEPSAIRELEQKRVELAMERQRFFDQRREFNKLIAAEGRRSHLEDRLVDAAEKLDATVGRAFAAPGSSSCGENEAVLIFSDWHYGMITQNIYNTYNIDICKQRVRSVVDRTIERVLRHDCSAVHIVVLGDLFHGAIHTSARVMSEELACDQLMQVSEIFAQAIGMVASCVPDTFVYMTYGNHARTVQNKHDSVHRDNMERIIPWWLRQRLSGAQNIHIMDDPKNEFLFLNVCGHGFCAAHGDLDNVRTSPRMIATLFNKVYGADVDYVLLGDKHHSEAFDELGIRAMIIDALCGTDDFANEKRLYCTPGQLLLIVNEDGVDAEYHLKCK